MRWWIVAAGIFIVLLVIYYVIPLEKKSLSSILPGTVFSLAGLLAVSAGLSIYVNNNSRLSVVYGSLGAAVVFMMWLYFTGMGNAGRK